MKLILRPILFLSCLSIFSQASAFSKRIPNQDYGVNTNSDYSGHGGGSSSLAGGATYTSGGSSESADASAYAPSGVSLGSSSGCSVSCSGGSTVKVDVRAKCMCITASDCFKVDTGKSPLLTTDGTGTIGVAKGARYATKSTTSNGFDNDAVTMGIGADTSLGKWFHKAHSGASCKASGGGTSTIGCIGVPCSHWSELKSQMGQSVTVCNGASPGEQYSSVHGQIIHRNGGQ